MPPENDAAVRIDELGYCGTATLVINGEELGIEVGLRGFFQPIDGTYRWHGRVRSPVPALVDLVGDRAAGLIRTPHGRAPVTVDEVDLWGRYRLRGTGPPTLPRSHNAGRLGIEQNPMFSMPEAPASSCPTIAEDDRIKHPGLHRRYARRIPIAPRVRMIRPRTATIPATSIRLRVRTQVCRDDTIS